MTWHFVFWAVCYLILGILAASAVKVIQGPGLLQLAKRIGYVVIWLPLYILGFVIVIAGLLYQLITGFIAGKPWNE